MKAKALKPTKANITRVLTSGVGYIPKQGTSTWDRAGWNYLDTLDGSLRIGYFVTDMERPRERAVQLQRITKFSRQLRDAGIASTISRDERDMPILIIA